ncbi:MAG: KamA family radical SAM protein [Bacteroidales bacterium]|jgi:KamA family protein|nr:KamA family radical SAM protein [Bacteroidales bacterium]
MDWKHELKNNLTKAEDLDNFSNLSSDQQKKLKKLLLKYPMSVTRYYFSLIDQKNNNDPIKKMCIPSKSETIPDGSYDTSGEANNTILTGLQHKYDETAMILSTNQCAMYCRHCFRKRLVGVPEQETIEDLTPIENYVKKHKEISNVLISGGDSFLNNNKTIKKILDVFSGIEHLEFIRFGTRTPVVFPERITKDEELTQILKDYNLKKQIYVVTQFNHPAEITTESQKAVKALISCGIPVRNQTVLLKGINDSSKTLGTLLKKLTSIGVLPYYIFQCRPVKGVKNQFQVPLKRGLEIVEKAKSMQNGQGKGFKFCMSHVNGKIEILGIYEDDNMIFKYHQAKDKKENGKIFSQKIDDEQCWLK